MKYYLDTSSLVKIYHSEEGSKDALELYEGDRALCISELGALEFVSAVYRKCRENEIDSNTTNELVLKFREDTETRYELLAFYPLVFEEASRLLEIYGSSHALRTLDSLQFAFFSTYCETEDIFVCSDKRLASVVALEGHRVLVPTGHVLKGDDGGKEASFGKIFLSPPHMGGEEVPFVKKAFKSNYIAPLGPMVNAFEKEFAEYVGIEHCAAVSSGTAAMHLGLRHLGVGQGPQRNGLRISRGKDEVFASTLTFIGSVTPIIFQGGTPVFIDCDRESWNMDPNLLEEELERCSKRGKLPKAVVPRDLYGQCCDYDRIFDVCERYGVPVVVDAAEAVGSRYLTPQYDFPNLPQSNRFSEIARGRRGKQRRKGAKEEESNSMLHARSRRLHPCR